MALVYWIRLPEHTNLLSEGYIGVATDWARRVRQHRHRFKNIWDKVIMTPIVSASESYCFDLEKKLRPLRNIGWNIAAGGYRNNVMCGKDNPNFQKFGEQAPRFIGWYITPLGKFARPEDAAKAHNCEKSTVTRRCKGRLLKGKLLPTHPGYAFEQKA